MTQAPSYIADVDIAPSLFVNVKANTDHTIEPCAAGALAIGVSHEGTQTAAIPGLSSNPAIAAGTSGRVYGLTDNCEVFAGATIQAGQYLKPDANAKAVPAVTGNQYSAFARTGAAADEKCQITLEQGVAP